MKIWEFLKEGIPLYFKMVFYTWLFLLPFVLVPLAIWLVPEICGIVGGIIASISIALWGTTKLVHTSNHFGDEAKTYQDYTDKPMECEIKRM